MLGRSYGRRRSTFTIRRVEAARNTFFGLEEEGILIDGYVYWMLGNLYLDKDSLEVNVSKAEQYYKKGWELKHIPCLTAIGLCKSLRGQKLKRLGYSIWALPLVLYFAYFDKNSPRIRM